MGVDSAGHVVSAATDSPGKFPVRIEIAVAADGETAVTRTDVKELAGSR